MLRYHLSHCHTLLSPAAVTLLVLALVLLDFIPYYGILMLCPLCILKTCTWALLMETIQKYLNTLYFIKYFYSHFFYQIQVLY